MKRAVAGAATLLGLVLVLCAVMIAVLLGWRGTWHVELDVPAGRTAVVLRPSVASVIGPATSVQASTTDSTSLFVGRARPDDTAALVGTVDRLDVEGLAGARQLSTSSRSGSGTLPAPSGLDVWGSSATGSGTVRLSYRATPGAQAVVVASADGQPLPALTLRVGWSDRTWLWGPVLLALLGFALLALARRWRPRPAGRAMSPAARRRQRLASNQATRRAAVSAGGSAKRPSSAPPPVKHVGRRRAEPASRRRR